MTAQPGSTTTGLGLKHQAADVTSNPKVKQLKLDHPELVTPELDHAKLDHPKLVHPKLKTSELDCPSPKTNDERPASPTAIGLFGGKDHA